MPSSPTARLVVNADDFGWNREATDLTCEAFGSGTITSATAMVFMEDSDRAAALGREIGIPAGLHLNLTDPYTGTDVPDETRRRQELICEEFSARKFRFRSWTYDPRLASRVAGVLGDQLGRFEALYGSRPTHVDGHNHVHSCPNVALSGSLKAVPKMRNGLRAWPSARGAMALARGARRRLTYGQTLTTRYFLDIAELFRDQAEGAIAAQVALANRTSVEVMAHPAFAHEWEALSSPLWKRLVAKAPLGSYADLQAAT